MGIKSTISSIQEWRQRRKKRPEKVVVIVPGTFGIGQAASVMFAAAGFKVVIGGRDEENGRRVVEAAVKAGGQAQFCKCDLLEERDIEGLISSAIKDHGGLDAVFACPDCYLTGLAADQASSDFDFVMNYNCRSLFFVAKHAIPPMVKAGGGSIVFLSSAYGLASGSNSCAYEASKGTAMQLARSVGAHYGGKGVRVNCIAAGPAIDSATGLAQEVPSFLIQDQGEIQRLSRSAPMGRLARLDEIAKAALFLASDDSPYVTGSVVTVDGGLLCRR